MHSGKRESDDDSAAAPIELLLKVHTAEQSTGQLQKSMVCSPDGQRSGLPPPLVVRPHNYGLARSKRKHCVH